MPDAANSYVDSVLGLQKLICIDTERGRNPFEIVQGNISRLALDVCNKCAVQTTLKA